MVITVDWIQSVLSDFINDSPVNSLRNQANEKAWDDPLVGFSRGDDSLYDAYKGHIGLFHWTPLEIISMTFPDMPITADQLTVISWILPQTRKAKEDNRREDFFPAERWARSRIFGEMVNIKLREHVVSALQKRGCAAVAPQLSEMWKAQESVCYGRSSTWSERHAAFAAGLGTFGLCDGLITARGKAVRIGSVVAHVKIPPTPRPYKDHHAYCLFYAKGTCKKCIARCPVGAISELGHDKIACYNHTVIRSREHIKSNYELDGYGCGLCQTKVPCESTIPNNEFM
jgi:epoxyqueuosine reductase